MYAIRSYYAVRYQQAFASQIRKEAKAPRNGGAWVWGTNATGRIFISATNRAQELVPGSGVTLELAAQGGGSGDTGGISYNFV